MGGIFSVDDRLDAEMYSMAEEILGSCGIRRYEISNYARPGCECIHNVHVWRGGLLRGYGPAAADFDGVDRHIQTESLHGWLAGEAPECDRIPPERRRNEIFAVNLRTVAGWDEEMWNRVPGADGWADRHEIAAAAERKFPGCWQISPETIALSPVGLMFWNDIAAELL